MKAWSLERGKDQFSYITILIKYKKKSNYIKV